MKYLVTHSHRTEYPHPIRLQTGDQFTVGERDEGPEGWENWHFCTKTETSGWMPAQRIEMLDEDRGRALADFDARELDVDMGDVLTAGETMNGWIWCTHNTRAAAGWVPLSHLQALPD